MADTRNDKFYHTYYNMRTRCLNPRAHDFPRYGGRGIRIAERWMSFGAFETDMRPTYSSGLQLERIDNGGNYEPGNCRWATPKEQANNRRSNRVLTYQGKSLTVAQWADSLGIKYGTFKQRLYVYKWPLDRLIGGAVG